MTLGPSSHCGEWETPGHPLESGSRVEVGVPGAEEEGDPSLERQVHSLGEEEPQGQRCGKMLCDLPTLWRGSWGQSWEVGACRRAGRPLEDTSEAGSGSFRSLEDAKDGRGQAA